MKGDIHRYRTLFQRIFQRWLIQKYKRCEKLVAVKWEFSQFSMSSPANSLPVHGTLSRQNKSTLGPVKTIFKFFETFKKERNWRMNRGQPLPLAIFLGCYANVSVFSREIKEPPTYLSSKNKKIRNRVDNNLEIGSKAQKTHRTRH